MHQPRRLKNKLKPLPELKREVEQLKTRAKQVVFTNGCFDILHAGHVQYLQDARDLGDLLIVAVNSDCSVRALKGPDRPVNPQAERAEVVAALEAVDYVVIFEEPDPLKVIEEIRPHILVKGGDWPVHDIVGRQVVEESGGRVLSIPLQPGVSTTRIIKRIAKHFTP